MAQSNWENASHVFMPYFHKLNLHRFYIVFEGEEGQDAGGLLREWYVIISREIFNPMYALFKVSPGDKVTYTIYEQSQTNPNHLDYFKFVGRVIAKAIYDNKLLECYFARSAVIIPSFKYRDFCDITKLFILLAPSSAGRCSDVC